MTIECIYPPFEESAKGADIDGPFGAESVFAPAFSREAPIFSTSLFPDPEGRPRDEVIERKGKSWNDCYLAPLHTFAKSGAQILLFLDDRLEELAGDLPKNVVVRIMRTRMPGYDAMLWRYLGAAEGNVFFCGCDDFTHPPIVDYLVKMKFDLIRWSAPCDVDTNRMCIFRTLKGAFYLRQPVRNIATIMNAFYASNPVPIKILGNSLFGNAKGVYGYDEVFVSRYFYYRFAGNMATIVLKCNQPSLFFESLDLPYLKAKNTNSTVIYAMQ